MRRRLTAAVLALTVLAAGCESTSSSRGARPAAPTDASSTAAAPSTAPTAAPTAASAAPVPRPAHVVIVVLENHSYREILDPTAAPFLTSLARSGVTFTQSFAITHPSQPNYLALFSGSTQGVTDDSCPHTFAAANLASELRAAHDSFAGYAEALPATGFTGCASGRYARKHAPWVDFTNVPAADNRPFSAFPTNYAALPTVSFVIPDLDHDMHDGTVSQGDRWLSEHLGGYAAWARTHRSLLIVTADEDDGSASNRIATIVAGADVRPGSSSERIDDYRVLGTLTAAYGLAPLTPGTPITDIWR